LFKVSGGFFGRLKNEMLYNCSWQKVFLEAFCTELDNCIYWYNEELNKILLGGRSPIEYHRSLGLAPKSPSFCLHTLPGTKRIL